MLKYTLLVIIHGPPCTGKSTLAKRLSKKFDLPFLSRDKFKEMLFDSFGWSDVASFNKISETSLKLLFVAVELFVSSGQHLIVDSTFNPRKVNDFFLRLKRKYKIKVLQINCKTDGPSLVQRYFLRSPKRHPGYVDHLRFRDLKKRLMRGYSDKLKIAGEYLELDTTNFKRVDYQAIEKAITKLM